MNVLKTMIGLCVLAVGAAAWADDETNAVTKPSEDYTLSFARAGLVAKILVKEGDAVKEGQLIVQQDDTAERAEADSLKVQAESTVRIKAAEAQLAQKKVDSQIIDTAAKKGAATELEVAHAHLDVTIADLTLELSKFEHDQDVRKFNQAKLSLDRMQILSKSDGKVEQIFTKAGEVANVGEKVIRVVKTDPLWIDVQVPQAEADELVIGQAAAVRYPATRGHAAQTGAGKVIFVAGVANSGSRTLTVRVEAPNPAGRKAGEHVNVTFPTPATAPGGSSQPASGAAGDAVPPIGGADRTD
jgi:RND family efflux transporter MFP subunit